MKFLKILLFSFFLFYIFSFTFTISSDFTQDLGRHLKLGEMIVKTKTIPTTNLFSYTNANFPFINHHWLSEVIFYLFSKIFGLNSLIILKTIIILISVGFVIKTAEKKSSIIPAVLSGIILSPLLLERNDIRPEIFGYFFFSFVFYILCTYPNSKKLVYFLPLVMFIWINTHISFIFGVFLIILLMLKIFTFPKKKRYLTVLLLSLIVLLLNPRGVSGLLYPLNIFQNYGYTIVENQNLFYLNEMIFNPLIKYFFLISPVIIISVLVLITVNQLTIILVLLTFFILTILQLRHLPFFILAAIPGIAILFDQTARLITQKYPNTNGLKPLITIALILVLFLGSVFFISNKYYFVFDSSKRFGLGYTEISEKATEFVRQNNLSKNIFNNFDVGGYFIYNLYPDYKVFIDNRPEAYPKNFVENIYKELQIEQSTQDVIFNKYKIKTIFFNHNDQTQWAEIFVARVLKDKDWRLLYLDSEIFIASKNQRLTDIRKDKKVFDKLINSEEDYLNLLKLARLFSIVDDKESADSALLKAKELNPDSCLIISKEFSKYLTNSQFYFYKAEELKKSYWYCF